MFIQLWKYKHHFLFARSMILILILKLFIFSWYCQRSFVNYRVKIVRKSILILWRVDFIKWAACPIISSTIGIYEKSIKQTAGNFPIKKYLSRLISCGFDSFTWGITCVQMCWSFAVLFFNIRGVKTCHQIHLPPYFSVVEQSMITLKVAQWPSYITTCHSSLRTKILYFLWMRDAIR